MANAGPTLVTSGYTLPGAYIGQIFTPRPASLTGNPRLPGYIAKGNRLQILRDVAIKRSYVTDEALVFPPTAPYEATLQHAADGNQANAILRKSNGNVVPTSKWSFTGQTSLGWTKLLINSNSFDPLTTYYLDYQSTDRSYQDPLPFDEIREVLRVGDSAGQSLYVEGEHFRLPSTIVAPVADSGNTNDTPDYWPKLVSGDPEEITVDSATAVAVTLPAAVRGDGVAGYYVDAWFVVVSGTGAGQTAHVTAWDETGLVMTVNTMTTPLDATSVIHVLFSFWGDEANTGTGYIFPSASSDYTHNYSRDYEVEVTAAGGVAPSRTATFKITATPLSGGNGSDFAKGDATDNAIEHSVTEGVDDTDVALEYGLLFDVDWGDAASGNLAVGDKFYLTGLGPALMELSSAHGNTNERATITDPLADAGDAGAAAAPTVNNKSSYTGSDDRDYELEVTAVAGGIATLRWRSNGELPFGTGTISLDDATPSTFTAVSLERGIYLDFDGTSADYQVGDLFTLTGLAARAEYTGKDDRNYDIDVTAAPSGSVQIFYSTDTPEGRFGTAITTDAPSGALDLPDGILLHARNIQVGSIAGSATGGGAGVTAPVNQHTAGDNWDMSTALDDVLDWTLTEENAETFLNDDILEDPLGIITGTPASYYLILDQVPDAISRVFDPDTDSDLSYSWIADSPFIGFLTKPSGKVQVDYTWRSQEPDPGNVYYITASILRPANLYNTPILVLDEDQAEEIAGPAAVDNDLHVMAFLALEQNPFGMYLVQIKDADEDGVYTNLDYKSGVDAIRENSGITDLIVINNANVIGYAKGTTEVRNDPFEKKETLMWTGMPIGTPIGDQDTPNTLIYTARRTLQVSGDSPAHGAFILIGNHTAKRTILLPDNSETQLTLDGSFIAGAAAAKNASFSDPADTLLKQDLVGFDEMNEFSDSELILLGGASVTTLSDAGANLFRFNESLTVDQTGGDEFAEISAMNQKQFVTRTIRRAVDDSIISIVPPSQQAGVQLIRSFIAGALVGLQSRGLIAPWTDDSGNSRPLDPDSDIEVFADSTSKTLYHFRFWYVLRYPIKRAFGLFSVDQKNFGAL